MNNLKLLFIGHFNSIYSIETKDFMNIILYESEYDNLKNLLLKIIEERGDKTSNKKTIYGYKNNILKLLQFIKSNVKNINITINNLKIK